MPNPLFNALCGGQMPGPFGNFQQMLQQFRQFCNTFRGDPHQKVMELMQNGQINQNQLNYLQQMARKFQQMMGWMK